MIAQIEFLRPIYEEVEDFPWKITVWATLSAFQPRKLTLRPTIFLQNLDIHLMTINRCQARLDALYDLRRFSCGKRIS